MVLGVTESGRMHQAENQIHTRVAAMREAAVERSVGPGLGGKSSPESADTFQLPENGLTCHYL